MFRVLKNEILFKLNGWTFVSFIIGLFIIIPIAFVAIQFNNSSENWHHIQENVLYKYIYSTLILVLGTGVLSVFFGVITAWIISFYEFPGRKLLEWGLILPLTIPTYIAAYSYYDVLETFTPLMLWIRNNISFSAMNLFNDFMVYFVTIIVLSSVLFPYVYLSTRASFLMQGNKLIESAKILGHLPGQIFWNLILPLSRPAIVAGLSLVIMETLNDFGAVEYFGISTFTTGIFRSWMGMDDVGSALRLSSYLMFFVLLLMYFEKRMRGNAKFDQNDDSSLTHKRLVLSSSKSKSVLVICLVPLMLGFIIPVIRLSLWSVSASKDFFNIELMQILFNSIGLASFSSIIIVIVSIILLFSSKYFSSQIIKITNQFAVLGYSIPGAVIAMGILLVSAYINDITNIIITGTISSLFIAYLIRFLAVSSQPIDSGLEKECSQINQASRNLGKTAFHSLMKINLPLLKKPIFVGAILIFIDVFKELPLTLILRPFNFDTLATLTYDLNKQAQIFDASIPALIIIIVTTIPIILLNKKLERKS